MKALSVAEFFTDRFGAQILGGAAGYRPELAAPDGPSTHGGAQAVQHIRLVSRSQGRPTLVAGWANTVTRKAEVRTFGYLRAVHAQRFGGKALPIHEGSYVDFLTALVSFFKDLQFTVSIVDQPPIEESEADPAETALSVRQIVVWALVLLTLSFTITAGVVVLSR